MRAACKIDGCERVSAGRGWCGTHWLRWRKYGDPMFVKRPGVDYMTKTECSAEGCVRMAHAHSFCTMHLQRWEKHGDPTVVAPITGRPLAGSAPRYTTIHKRLSRTRGSARNYSCVDCRGAAASWSYNNADPREVHDMVRGTRIAYSLDMRNYEPRCVSCHRKFDGAAEKRSRNEYGQFTGAGDDNPVGCHVAVMEATA